MKETKLHLKVTTIEPMLGLASGNKALQEEHIASKAPTATAAAEELEAIQTGEEFKKAMTVFPRDEKGLFWWDYQMRGAIKGFMEMLIELGDCKLSKWSYKKAVDNFVFVSPRRIYLHAPDGAIWQKAPDIVQRPLRATTMQGDRIALASSEALPEGTTWECFVSLLTGSNSKSKTAILTPEDIHNAMALTTRSGFGQWRGGGWGRATVVVEEVAG